jgi:thiamine kinase-like enzyme
LAFKNLSPGLQLPTARRVRPQFLYDPGREIATYERLLDHLKLGTARYLGNVTAPEQSRYWLFLEWVKGPLLWQMGGMQHWQNAARWLAKFQFESSRMSGFEQRLRCIQTMVYDRHAYADWITRAETLLRNTLLRRDPRAARKFARIVRGYDRVVDTLLQLPKALTHGEFYPANIVMRWTGVMHEVCPIDWELTGWGPAVLDLAALSAGRWSTRDKRKILTAYLETAKGYSRRTPDIEDLTESVEHAQLHLCIRQLGWAARWRPQGQQARAWLAQALNLADNLRL